MTQFPPRDTLERWASGTRSAPLPAREGAVPPAISVEFFAPKTPSLEAQLWSCIERLADEFHFYTLNRPDLVYAVARSVGVKPQAA